MLTTHHAEHVPSVPAAVYSGDEDAVDGYDEERHG